MNWVLISCFMIFGLKAQSQEILTLDQAKEITLANNFGIKIAQNNVTIAENQTDKSVNGFLPTVTANGGINSNFGSSTQQFNNGNEANVSNAFNWGLSGSVDANYTIYNKARAISLEQLKESLDATNLTLRQTIEQSLLNVYSSYYVVAQLSENIGLLEETLLVSEERKKRAQYALDLGQGSGLAVLNAQVDIQRDSVNLLNAILSLETEKRNLNVAMGRDTDIAFDVEKDSDLTNVDTLESLVDKGKIENISIQLNRQNLIVNEYNLDLINVENKPTLSTGLSYSANFSDNASGAFITQSSSNGFAGNIGVNWTIFDGTRSIRRQNAVLNLSNQKLQIDQLEQQIERDIINTWNNYQNDLFVIGVQEKALETNRENFIRTEEQFKRGQVNSIEFRQAQLNLLNAQFSLTNAKYSAKIREIQLKQLVGDIMN